MRDTMQTPRRFTVVSSAAGSILVIALITFASAEPPVGPPDVPPPPRGEPGEPPPPPRDGDFRGGPPQRPPREGGQGDVPPRERGTFRPDAGGPPDRPSPERFVERAMRYDDDKDGKLDRDELTKFAEDLMERFRPGPGEPPPSRDRFNRGEGPEGATRPERPLPPGDGERPQRLQRPDGEEGRQRRSFDGPPPPPPASPERDDS